MECRRLSASVRLDAGELDHLGPFLRFVGDELSEVGGRAATWFLQLTGLLVPLRSLGHLRTAAIVVV
jgi:hypothetical protein